MAVCGSCHPGGGLAETDRGGRRYDDFMRERGYLPGAINDYDGDYFRSFWTRSGVLEADCLICHLPGYRFKERAEQIKRWNFKWAATAGGGLGKVLGSVKEGQSPRVIYDLKKFLPDGRLRPRFTREIPSKNCLFCHRRGDTLKRATAYLARDDVHLRAGLRCVDCHWAGSRAGDSRIFGRERHEIGKGDDPSGFVRDDLDGSVRPCFDCHGQGRYGAPKVRHLGLPLRHLEKIACQGCHVARRSIRAALIQEATVLNQSPEIRPPLKRVWSLYGPDGRPWNFFALFDLGNLTTSFDYAPEKGWYKGKIWPLNRVHTLWVGLKAADQEAIKPLPMKVIFGLWRVHFESRGRRYSELSQIVDDNKDGFPEVNRPEEIRAILSALSEYYRPSEGERIVLVRDAAYTEDGSVWQPLFRFPWEASPYASTFKISHNILPARAALGAKGCTECHSFKSEFFYRPTLTDLWGRDGELLWEPNYKVLGYSHLAVWSGSLRQEILEPLLYYGTLAGLFLVGLSLVLWASPARNKEAFLASPSRRIFLLMVVVALLGPTVIVLLGRFLTPLAMARVALFHKLVAPLAVVGAFGVFLKMEDRGASLYLALGLIIFQAVTGLGLVFLQGANLRQILFTLHDLGAMAAMGAAAMAFMAWAFRRRPPEAP